GCLRSRSQFRRAASLCCGSQRRENECCPLKATPWKNERGPCRLGCGESLRNGWFLLGLSTKKKQKTVILNSNFRVQKFTTCDEVVGKAAVQLVVEVHEQAVVALFTQRVVAQFTA